MSRRTLLAALVAALALPAAAAAEGDPIMPLSQVHRGQSCTGYSVIQGTDIVPFNVEVQDVITGDTPEDARILFKVSGPAVDATGIGPGFSGSPIYCPDDQNVQRNIGAISEGIGEYGNKVGLATPIEEILAEPIEPPAAARHSPRTLRRAHVLATPLTVGGLHPALASVVNRVARSAGRTVYAAPAAPRADFAPQALRPGSAFSVGFASGALALGAIGTIAYTDGDQVWGFGHPLDSVGRRDLFLQDAYVFTVVNNPLGVGDASTYKFAAPGHDLGTLLGDGIDAVTGRVGALPDRFPLAVHAKDADTGREVTLRSSIADETPVGNPSGASSVGLVAPLAVGEAAYSALRGSPARQSGSLCMQITVQERTKPMGFCNTYIGGTPGQSSIFGSPMVADASEAVALVDEFTFRSLHVTGMNVDLRVRRGLAQGMLVKLAGPHRMVRGRTYKIRATLQHPGAGREVRKIPVRVPRYVSKGRHDLILVGTAADASGSISDEEISIVLGFEDEEDPTGPRTVDALAHQIAQIHRYDGVVAAFADPGGEAFDDNGDPIRGERTYRDPDLRVSGTARLRGVKIVAK